MKFLNYSLSLSLSLREYRSINKKFHKTSKIKNRESIDEEMEMSSGVARGRSRFVGRATRGDDKPRGRGRGRRNIDLWRVLLATFF